MFTNFKGSNLIEAYHRRKKAERTSDNKMLQKTIKILFAVLVSLGLWLAPTEFFGIEGLTLIEQRVIAIFAFATLMWVLEAKKSLECYYFCGQQGPGYLRRLIACETLEVIK